jgi:hypothetical protein
MFVRRRAFTIAEALISCVLLLIILGVVGESIRMALRAQRKGEAQRQATAFGREVLHRIGQEMATAISVGLLPGGGELASGVIYPDYREPAYQAFPTEPLYRREQDRQVLPNSAGTVKFDRVYNRVIFTTPGKRSANFSDSLSEYVVVEFVVPPRPDAPTVPQSRLFRRTFRLQSDPLATSLPCLDLLDNYAVIRGAFFSIDPSDPMGNVNQLEASLTPEARNQRGVVVELPRADDRIEFSVEHTEAAPLRTRPLPNDPKFQPHLFGITAALSLDKQGNDNFLASQVVRQQVTIKSGF